MVGDREKAEGIKDREKENRKGGRQKNQVYSAKEGGEQLERYSFENSQL